jgi:hypothetical protein
MLIVSPALIASPAKRRGVALLSRLFVVAGHDLVDSGLLHATE